MAKFHIKKDDTVKVISGESRGEEGKVLEVYPAKNKALVEGVNMVKRHTKPNAAYPNGGIVEKEALPDNARVVGAYMMEQLKPFEERYRSVGEVRGKGLMLALDLVVDKKTRQSVDPLGGFSKKLANVAEREGVLVRAVGPKLIISPPLTFTCENVDELTAALTKAFDEVDK